MITQVLNRDFVLRQLEKVKTELEKPADARRTATDLPHNPTEAEKEVAVKTLIDAKAHEDQSTSGQVGYDNSSERRGEASAPIDDTAFISHDPDISLLQTALTEYYYTQGAAKLIPKKKPSDRRGGGDFQPVGARDIADAKAIPQKQTDGRRLFEQYSLTDIRWVASLYAKAVTAKNGRHPFNEKPAAPLMIANRVRLILVGDWGSGLPRAINVAGQMKKLIQEGAAAGLEQHVIHLGDVYYSGWPEEYRRNFLPHWPVAAAEAGQKLMSWCLNGNHDMYSGGHGYYDTALADPRFGRQERSSFFSLHNDHWDLFGLDTAYEDAGLYGPQLEWLKSTRRTRKRSLLMSHHQLFSAYESRSKILTEKIGPYLSSNPVDSWFWGHEHRCIWYKESEGIKYPRLVGHGGVPVYMTHGKDSGYKEPALYENREYIKHGLERWAYFGFAVLDLDGRNASVRYISETGKEELNKDPLQ